MNTLLLSQPERGERRGLALLLAGGVHLALLLLLVFGLQWQVKPDEPVAVELWASLPQPSRPEIRPAIAKPEQPSRPAPKPRLQPEPAPVKQPDIAVQQAKPKPQPRRDPKAEPEPPKAKPKLEPEPTAPAEPKPEARPKPVNRAAELARLAEEFSSSVSPAPTVKPGQAAANAAAKAAADYTGVLVDRIQRNVVPPADSKVNHSAVFEVTLLPSMEVLRAVKRRSSGNPAYDDAVERAILKTSPFPPLPEGLAFRDFRSIVMEFRPE